MSLPASVKRKEQGRRYSSVSEQASERPVLRSSPPSAVTRGGLTRGRRDATRLTSSWPSPRGYVLGAELPVESLLKRRDLDGRLEARWRTNAFTVVEARTLPVPAAAEHARHRRNRRVRHWRKIRPREVRQVVSRRLGELGDGRGRAKGCWRLRRGRVADRWRGH